ncbi:MAG: efflux RND transporter periplasmic adaptor subunit [Pseudomonadota bacterium]|nr:efflux RND transporter periplasmic adaptor subunit [Pseudomonadota bacterium]
MMRGLSRNVRTLVWVVAGLILIALLYWLWLGRNDAQANTLPQAGAADRPVTVVTARSFRADFSIERDIPATIAPLQQVIVRPQISGQIERLYFEEGQLLQAGQLMATLDSRSIRADLASSEAELARIQVQRETAQQEQQRYQTLLRDQAVSQQEAERLVGQTKQLDAQLNAARAAIDAQQVRLSLTRITAPITGRVGLRQVSVGAQVSSSDSTGIATLTQTIPISVQFGVPEQWLVQGEVLGRSIQLYAVGTNQMLAETRISRQDSQVNASTGALSVRALLPNTEEQFWSGQSVVVRIPEQQFKQVVLVPSQAIQQGLNQSFVYVVEQGVAKMTPIQRVAQNEQLTVVEGLDPDLEVVIEGQLRLKDGSKVSTGAAS